MRELCGNGLMTVSHIPTESNPADLFTKVLNKQPFEKHQKFVMNLPGDAGQKHDATTKKLRKCVNNNAPIKGGQHAISCTRRVVAGSFSTRACFGSTSRGGSVPRRTVYSLGCREGHYAVRASLFVIFFFHW